MKAQAISTAKSGFGMLFGSAAVLCLSIVMSGCTGMSAPYSSRKADRPDEITLVPITADLVSGIKAKRNTTSETTEILPAAKQEAYNYVIKPGDVLEVSLSPLVTFNSNNSNNLIGEAGRGHVVYPDGSIYLPYAGEVSVGGLTPRDAQKQVIRALSKFLKNPEVVVSVLEFRSQRVLLTGQVKSPGYVPITDVPLTLLGTLSGLGVLTEVNGAHDPRTVGGGTVSEGQPDASKVSLKRDGKEYFVDARELSASLDRSTDIVLCDGDVVSVPALNRGKVYVMGEVGRPSLLEIEPDVTNLGEVILSAGGIDQLTAKASRVYIIRGDLKEPTIYQLNAAAPDSFMLAQEFPVQSKDIVFVSTAGITRWNRFLSQLLPSITGVAAPIITANQIQGNNN